MVWAELWRSGLYISAAMSEAAWGRSPPPTGAARREADVEPWG